jgi:hypothetical protein
MRDYLAASMRAMKTRQESGALAELNRLEAEAQAARAAEDRAIRKQVKAEWRASLSPAERLLDTARDFRWLGLAWLFVTIPLAALAVIAGVLVGGPTGIAIGIGAGIYLVVVAVAFRVAKARERHVPPEHLDRVREQLERVHATLDS